MYIHVCMNVHEACPHVLHFIIVLSCLLFYPLSFVYCFCTVTGRPLVHRNFIVFSECTRQTDNLKLVSGTIYEARKLASKFFWASWRLYHSSSKDFESQTCFLCFAAKSSSIHFVFCLKSGLVHNIVNSVTFFSLLRKSCLEI